MSVIGRLFGRRKLVVPEHEQLEQVFVQPVLARVAPEPDFEEDWEWRIAAARVTAVAEPAPPPATVMLAQPRTVIPVPSLPVARDPSMVRLRQDTQRTILPPRTRFARGTAQHVPADDDDTARVDIRRRFSR